MFDPYYKWLGIRPEHQPPDHYRLLGLERFESDRDVIQAAGERQMAHVQSYKIGPQSDLSQKILNEIARAKVCLLNPASKAEYDAALRAAAAPAAPPPAAFQPAIRPSAPPVVAPDTITLAKSPRASDSSAKLRAQRKPKRKPQTLPLVVIGVCLVVLVGAVASTFLVDFSGAPSGHQAVLPPPAASRVNSPSRSSSPDNVDRPLENSTAANLPQPNGRSDRARASSLPGSDARHPIPTSEQIQEARSKFTIQGELTPTVTLDAGNKATHPWTRYALFQMTIELASKAEHANWPEARRCALEAARLLVAEYQLPNDFDAAIVSQFQRRPPEMRSMARDRLTRTPPSTGKPLSPPPAVTNPDLAKSASPDSDVLIVDAPLIDLTKNQTEVSFKPLVNVESRKLILTGLDVIGTQVLRKYPERGQVELGVPVRLFLRDEPPRAGVEISLHGTVELNVRIKPIIQDFEGKPFPWTQSGIRDVRRRVTRSINARQEELGRAQRFEELLTEQLAAATKASAGTANRKSLQERLEISKIESADARIKLQILETFMANFSEIEKLSDRIDRKCRVSFRVICDQNGGEATIVETSP